jgi:MOSC domain-containing protein YiiM
MRQVTSIEVVAAKGILGNDRYFDRRRRSTGEPSKRQLSLIEREQIADHALALQRPAIPPGAVRANIETLGIELIALIGKEVRVGEAILRIAEARTPCAKMDAVHPGLRARMGQNHQGVLAEVVQSGRITAGDRIWVDDCA